MLSTKSGVFYVTIEKESHAIPETLKYIGILTLLAECDALVSTVTCGAFRFAVGLNDHRYEFTKVYTVEHK